MSLKWKEMTGKDKALSVLGGLFALAALVFAVLDMANVMAHAHSFWEFSFGLMCFVECVKYWGKNRRDAIIGLVCAVLLITLGVVNFL